MAQLETAMKNGRIVIAAGWLCWAPCVALAQTPPTDSPAAMHQADQLNKLPPVSPAGSEHIDRSGRKQNGRGSYYSKHFTNKKMADGHRMNPNSDIAASKTLPLGTVAKVTNLDNGKTETVKIEDRGPYVRGRVVDVAPKVADKLDMKTKGVTPVEVKPITIPEPDGGVKLGAGAADSSPQEIRNATTATKELAADPKTADH
jgi:rare lipoprotein A